MVYEYKCQHCGEVIERYARMGEAPEKVKCGNCGKRASRNWSSFPAVQCRYSYMERVNGNPRVSRGKG